LGNQTTMASSATPLSESLFQIYTYFMPRVATNMPYGRDGVTRFPVYNYDKFGGSGGSFPDIMQYACQKNFVIVVTGTGVGTYDDYHSDPTSTWAGFSNFGNLIGDYYAENLPPTPNPDVEVPGTADRRSMYLDDVAKYMHDQDLRSDLSDSQTVDVYMIGF